MACCLNGVTIKFHSFIHSYIEYGQKVEQNLPQKWLATILYIVVIMSFKYLRWVDSGGMSSNWSVLL